MTVSMIAAMSENRVIGRGGKLPWHLPEDLDYFKKTTLGHPVIMGRKTYESVGRPLPKRLNVIITRQADYRVPAGVLVVPSLEEALRRCEGAPGAEEVFICGGGEIYREAMARADRIYLTVIHQEIDGDARFPEVPGQFKEVSREDRGGSVPHSYLVLERPRSDLL